MLPSVSRRQAAVSIDEKSTGTGLGLGPPGEWDVFPSLLVLQKGCPQRTVWVALDAGGDQSPI